MDEPSKSAVEEAFDELVDRPDPAMVVVTTAAGGERSGCLVGFHAQVSIDPRRYGVLISKANHTHGVIGRADHAAVHFLDASDRDLAERFGGHTGDREDKFEGLELEEGPGGVPLLAASRHRFAARRVAVIDPGGDHALVVLDPEEVRSEGSFEPMRLTDVEDITPGHPA